MNRFRIPLFQPNCGNRFFIFCIDEGTITVNETCWLDTVKRQVLPPHKRHAGFVFQDEDLLPYLDVRKNLRYDLKRAYRGTHRFSGILVVELLDPHTLQDPARATGVAPAQRTGQRSGGGLAGCR